MMIHPRHAVVCLLAIALSALGGCGPSKGTCITKKADYESCIVNATALMCGKGEFTKEDEAAGILRCKTAGYDDGNGTGRAGEPTIFHKSKK